MTRSTRALTLALLAAGCPRPQPGDTTAGSTSADASTTGADTTGTSNTTVTPTSTSTSTGGTTTGGTTTGDPTIGGTIGFTTSTGDDDTFGPVDITCTYPGSTGADPLSPEVAPECACVGPDGFLDCASPLCPTISGSCKDNPDVFADECYAKWTYDEAALDCALVAARDGTEGTIRWGFSANSGFSSRSGFLHIVAGRRAIRQDRNHVDLGGEVSDTQLWQLEEPAYFQGCIDLPNFCERLHCFFAGTTGNALSLCLESFWYDDI